MTPDLGLKVYIAAAVDSVIKLADAREIDPEEVAADCAAGLPEAGFRRSRRAGVHAQRRRISPAGTTSQTRSSE